jgi:DNA-binding beta-propeller fold protein YncE
VIPISKMAQRIALSVDDKLVFTSDQVEPRLVAIDTATNTIERTLTLPAPGYGTAPTADGRWLVVPMPKANQVAVVDLRKWTVAHVIDVPKAPQEALVRPDGKIAYVSCDASGQVAAIRTSDWKLDTLITAGKYADGLAWAKGGR